MTTKVDDYCEDARQRGREAGIAAASWICDANTPIASIERTLRGLQEGRRRARAMRPQRLAEIERKMDAAGAVYRGAKAKLDYRLMADVRREIEALGIERKRLQDGPVEA